MPNNILFIDCETTNKLQYGIPLNHPDQPRIVQLAAVLTDDSGTELGSFSFLIRPDGWTIPKEAEDIHGISTHMATLGGVPIALALAVLDKFAAMASTVVAHNIDFDLSMVESEHLRKPTILDRSKDNFCTMKSSTNLCALPGKYAGQFKWPKLTEAHETLLGTAFDGAHDAMADVRACSRVYFELKRRGI